jgi:hypothetical protein
MSGAIHVNKQHRREMKIVEVAPPIARTSAPLTVGAAFHPAEQEADRVAHEVLARLRPDIDAEQGHVQRFVAATEGSAVGAEGGSVVGAEGGELPPAVADQIEGMRGRGEPLAPDVRGRMETAMGTDLGQVRVHTGPEAAALSNSLSALAFTRGSDIFFAPGQYAPETTRGQEVLAHELAHVVQQSQGAGRVNRLWDLKAANLPWTNGRDMRTLRTRNVWFVKDDSNDEIVVKIENQPIGLGDIVGSMQKKVANIKSVEQRKLAASDRGPLQALVEQATAAKEQSWIDRGKEINKLNNGNAASDDEYLQLAEDDAVKELQGNTKNVMAMTVAAGQKAEDWAAQPRGTGGDTQMRALLEAPGHCRMLGQMTAVDLVLDNEDRAFSGNLGNWFYTNQDPDLRSAMTLIDHVGPAQATFIATRDWNNRNNMKASNLNQTAAYSISQIESGMARAGDAGVTAWLDTAVNGKTRREKLTADFEVGLRIARLRMIDIFTATKFDLFSKKERATKKQIKAVANQAMATDEGDAKYAGKAAPNYYAEIKRRVMLMKSS